MRLKRDFIYDPSLVLYLPLYKLDGDSFMSKDAYGHLCTRTGALWRPNGHYFDGNDYINCGAVTSLQELTISWWMSPAAYDSARAIFGFRGTSAYESLEIRDNSIILVLDDGQNYVSWAGTNTYLGSWHYWTLYLAGSGINDIDSAMLKVNSTTLTPGAAVKNLAPDAWSSFIVGGAARATKFIGTFGEVWIHNRALSALESEHIRLATKWRYR